MQKPQLVERHFEEDFLITAAAYPFGDGQFQARAVITALGGQRTRGQRFFDLDVFATPEEAVKAAHTAGIDFVRKIV